MSSLPLTCDPWAEQEPLGFPVSFAPRRYRRRTSRWGQVTDTDPKSRLRHQPTLQSTDSLATCDLMSHALRIPPRFPVVRSYLCPFALRTAFPSSLTGRDPGDYYEHSVTANPEGWDGDPTFVSDVRIEHGCRHPTHLLQCPHWASLPPRRSTRTNHHAPAATDTGYRCRSGRSKLLPLEIGVQAIQPLPYRAGLPNAPSQASGPGRWFPDMLLSPSPFGSR